MKIAKRMLPILLVPFLAIPLLFNDAFAQKAPYKMKVAYFQGTQRFPLYVMDKLTLWKKYNIDVERIARAFSINPDILLMDEPFSGLDEITARKLRYELLNIWRNNQKTILFVTHNSFEATFLADKILIMNKCPGKIYKEIKVNIPRPRDYDNPMLFEFNRAIVKDFIKFISPDEDLQIED